MKRLLGVLILTCCWTLAGQAQQPRVILIHLDDTIQPISADYMARGLDAAAAQHADAVLIEINTPGGLLDSMRQMVSKIIASPVPVIVYVAPSGSRAGSAGFFLLEAADVAAMAPGSNAGAAHPVVEGGKLDDTMKQKAGERYGCISCAPMSRAGGATCRQPKMRSDLRSRTVIQEALQLKLIDLVAPDDASLAEHRGWPYHHPLRRFQGGVAHSRRAADAVDPTLREEILDRLTDPNLAVLVLVVGGLLIYLEFNTPGTIIPGTLGNIMVLLALFGLNLLPVRYTSVMLLVSRLCVVDPGGQFASHGVLAAAGIVCPGDRGSDVGGRPDSRAAGAFGHSAERRAGVRADHGLSLAACSAGAAKQSAHGRGRDDRADRGGHPAACPQRAGDGERRAVASRVRHPGGAG